VGKQAKRYDVKELKFFPEKVILMLWFDLVSVVRLSDHISPTSSNILKYPIWRMSTTITKFVED
jgi:hypothetical protein